GSGSRAKGAHLRRLPARRVSDEPRDGSARASARSPSEPPDTALRRRPAGSPAHALAAFTTCSSQNSSIPHLPFSRPSPLHLTPPKGTLALMLMCWLTQAVPHSRRWAISSPRATSLVHTEPPRP